MDILRLQFLRGNWLFSQSNSLIHITDFKTYLIFLKERYIDSTNIVGDKEGCKTGY